MTIHLQREMEALKRKILSLSALVEESVGRAVRSVEERDRELARKVIEADLEIDQMEVDLEEDCLKVLAVHQPVAIDLRFLVAVLKVNNDLERIGDEAVNIAERALYLATHDRVNPPVDLHSMGEKVRSMLKRSLDSLVGMDPDLARQVCAADDEIDSVHEQMFTGIGNEIRNNPHQLKGLVNLLSVSRHLERIADHATNIAEDVIYMAEGVITRHGAVR